MKKGRSGVVLAVITRPETAATMEQLIFRHTTSIGVRRHVAERDILPREPVRIRTGLGEIAAKSVKLPSGSDRIKVEADAAAELASAHGLSLGDVQRIADASVPQRFDSQRSGVDGEV
jgi:hypothetical protein